MNCKLSWDVPFILVALAAAILMLVVVGQTVLAPHTVRSYYLSTDGRAPVSCVYSSVVGDPDEPVFCSDDISKTLDVLAKANARLKK